MIALLTDFGLEDIYVGVMKAVIYSIAPDEAILDLTHAIPPQNIAVGAIQLAGAWDYLPEGAIVVGVVDPGVGGSRRAIAARLEGNVFVGPDNGLLSRLPIENEHLKCVELTNRRYQLQSRRGDTFHGRDIFAPIAAHIAQGVPLDELGSEVDNATLIRLPEPKIECAKGDTVCAATVALIDHFGNIVLDLPSDRWQRWRGISIHFDIHSVERSWTTAAMLATHYGSGSGELTIVPNSYGLIEIAKPTGSAAQQLPVGVGDHIKLIKK